MPTSVCSESVILISHIESPVTMIILMNGSISQLTFRTNLYRLLDIVQLLIASNFYLYFHLVEWPKGLLARAR